MVSFGKGVLPPRPILAKPGHILSGSKTPMTFNARVTVTLKDGVLDPQGKAIEGALHGLGFPGIGSVRQGKMFEVALESADKAAAEAELRRACEALLANTVIEDYAIAFLNGPA